MDLLTDVLKQSGLKSAFLKMCMQHGEWSHSFECPRSMAFHVISQGQIYVRSEKLKEPLLLNRGDILLMARGFKHNLTTDLKLKPLPSSGKCLAAPITSPSGKQVSLVCGSYQFWNAPVHPFFKDVPDYFVIRADSIATHEPLYMALQLLSLESAKPSFGSESITRNLLDILFNYILQRVIAENSEKSHSWSTAVRDPHVHKAISAMHAEWNKNWTLAELASHSGVSRAGLALKFKKLMGDTPLRYLATLRVQRATELLSTSDVTIENVAEVVGYSDGFAFSKMFKKITGESPRDFRKRTFAEKEMVEQLA